VNDIRSNTNRRPVARHPEGGDDGRQGLATTRSGRTRSASTTTSCSSNRPRPDLLERRRRRQHQGRPRSVLGAQAAVVAHGKDTDDQGKMKVVERTFDYGKRYGVGAP
jgi:hypothetical protein